MQAACLGPRSTRDAAPIGDLTFFVGRVLSITQAQDVDEIGHDSSKQLQVHFGVLERFPTFDSPVREADVLTAARGHGSGYLFVTGSTYLVFAEHRKGSLTTSTCYGTKLLSDAGEDLAYLRSVPHLGQTGEVKGIIECEYTAYNAWAWVPSWAYALVRQLLPPDLERRFLPGMQLRLDGGGVASHFAVTDGNGGFRFLNLSPGIYTLHLEEKGLNLLYGGPIRVVPGNSRTLWFQADVSRTVEGIAKSVSGKIAQGIEVDLGQVSEKDVSWQRGATTDEHGHFEIRNVASGTYYLGVNAGRPPSLGHPYNTWYYPGTSDLSRATLIRVQAQPETQKLNLALPPVLPSDVVTASVLAPDGQLIRDAHVYIRDVQSGRESTLRCRAVTGTIAFRAFEKRSYRIVAFAVLGAEPWMTKPLIMNFEASMPRTLKLVLSEHGEQKYREAIESLRSMY